MLQIANEAFFFFKLKLLQGFQIATFRGFLARYFNSLMMRILLHIALLLQLFEALICKFDTKHAAPAFQAFTFKLHLIFNLIYIQFINFHHARSTLSTFTKFG